MKGYKAFNKDLTCLGYQYELNKTHIFDSEPILCQSGFHFCTELEDVLNYYCFQQMLVFEIQASGVITDAKSNCSKRACSEIKLIRQISFNEIVQSITESKLAFYWAYYIGNRDVMIDKITDSKWAYEWAIQIGNRDIIIDRVTEPEYAYYWAMYIGNRDVMIDKITDSSWAFIWAKNIGNRDKMINKVTEQNYIIKWLYKWPEDKQYFIDKGVL